MEIEKIILGLQGEVNCRLYFTRKLSNGFYISYSPIIDDGVSEKLIELVVQYLEKQKALPVSDFSPIGCYDDTLEACKTEEIQNYQDVIESLQEDKVERECIESKFINKLNFYCLSVNCTIEGREKNIKFFRRITRFKKLSSKGMFGQIKNNRFSRIEAEMLGIDGDVDTIIVGEEVIILNHVALERIFSMSDQYIEKSEEAIQKIGAAQRIENFAQFEEDCKNDRRITRILTKLLNEEDKLEHCFENFENVKKAIDIFELDIRIGHLNEKETVVYERKDQLMNMVRLVRDSYYRSIIGERPGVDDSI
ncbi:MAG: DUF4868 domain-containing protein [Ruminococcus sp.]|nr:DUF4868 domain-containing protein [Ruminococcus sp.]